MRSLLRSKEAVRENMDLSGVLVMCVANERTEEVSVAVEVRAWRRASAVLD